MDKDEKIIRPSRKKNCGEKHDESTMKIDEIDFIDPQERVLEGLSISVPTRPLPKLAQPFWGRYIGQRVLLLLRDGAELVGTLRGVQWDFVRLENILEVGRNKRVTADWVVLDSSSVARFYPANAQIEHNG
jgi:hypothetical protein